MLTDVRVDIAPDKDEETVIYAKDMRQEVTDYQKAIKRLSGSKDTLSVYHDGAECFLSIQDVLFCESDDTLPGSQSVAVHTKDSVYGCDKKLYELEEVLPMEFMRVSKSTIANLSHVFSVKRNVTSSSLVTFADSYKQIYVSRSYFKNFKSLLDRIN